MNAEVLLAYYDRVVDAPDAVDKLRRLILDLAVRGKLVPQDSGDEPASALIKRIDSERQRLLARGEISKQRSGPKLMEDELPFALPPNWMWTRVRDITSDRGQAVPQQPFTYIDVTAINKKLGKIQGAAVLTPDAAPSRARKIARGGDVLYSCVRPYLLNVAIVNNDITPPPIVSTAFAVLCGFDLVLARYQWVVLRSPLFVSLVAGKMRGQAYPAINDADFSRLPFPLAPLAEQHRIVAKVDDLMSLCDKLEAARADREKTRDSLTAAAVVRLSEADGESFQENARFVLESMSALTARADQIAQLRSVILHLAVRGKLVPQDSKDEPASELYQESLARRAATENSHRIRGVSLRSEATESNGPFEIPSTWRWVRLVEIAEFSAGRTPSRTDASLWNNGEHAWVSISDMVDGQILQGTKETISKRARDTVFRREPDPPGTIIMSFKLTIGKISRLGIYAFHNEAIVSIKPYVSALDAYLFQVLPMFARQGNTKQAIKGATLNRHSIANILIPLPPLSEQQRIVAKVAELMDLCNKLETTLEEREKSRCRLLSTLLVDALAPAA